MNTQMLANAQSWVFDLDNTLYPVNCNLFPQIHKKMTAFIAQKFSCPADEALAKQTQYFHAYGTTLAGLMAIDNLEPNEFLDFVHDIDYTILPKNPLLQDSLINLNVPLYIFTNGTRKHAISTLQHLGIDEAIFTDIVGIEHVHYIPKPQEESFKAFFKHVNFSKEDIANSVMVEDIAKNLLVPHQYSMQTIWIENEDVYGKEGADDGHINYRTKSLEQLLSRLQK